jgi:hypothetical protein
MISENNQHSVSVGAIKSRTIFGNVTLPASPCLNFNPYSKDTRGVLLQMYQFLTRHLYLFLWKGAVVCTDRQPKDFARTVFNFLILRLESVKVLNLFICNSLHSNCIKPLVEKYLSAKLNKRDLYAC